MILLNSFSKIYHVLLYKTKLNNGLVQGKEHIAFPGKAQVVPSIDIIRSLEGILGIKKLASVRNFGQISEYNQTSRQRMEGLY